MGRSLKKPVYKKPPTRVTKKTVRTKKSKATKKQQNRKRYSKSSSKRRQSRKGTKKKKKTSTTSRGKKRTKKQKGVQEGGYLKTLDKQISHFNNNLKKVYKEIKTIYNISPVVKDKEDNTCDLLINGEVYILRYLEDKDGFSFTEQLENELKVFRTIAEALFYLIPRKKTLKFKFFKYIHEKYKENELEIQHENYKDVKTYHQFKIKDEKLLKNKQNGTYFLRQSFSTPGNYTLVIREGENNGKPVIKKLDITYNVNDEKYYYGGQVLEPNMYYYFKKISKTPSDVPLTNLLNDPNYPEMGYKYLDIINSGYEIFINRRDYENSSQIGSRILTTYNKILINYKDESQTNRVYSFPITIENKLNNDNYMSFLYEKFIEIYKQQNSKSFKKQTRKPSVIIKELKQVVLTVETWLNDYKLNICARLKEISPNLEENLNCDQIIKLYNESLKTGTENMDVICLDWDYTCTDEHRCGDTEPDLKDFFHKNSYELMVYTLLYLKKKLNKKLELVTRCSIDKLKLDNNFNPLFNHFSAAIDSNETNRNGRTYWPIRKFEMIKNIQKANPGKKLGFIDDSKVNIDYEEYKNESDIVCYTVKGEPNRNTRFTIHALTGEIFGEGSRLSNAQNETYVSIIGQRLTTPPPPSQSQSPPPSRPPEVQRSGVPTLEQKKALMLQQQRRGVPTNEQRRKLLQQAFIQQKKKN